MKRYLGAILVAASGVLGGVQTSHAGGATDAALGLGAFAVFNQIVRGETVFDLFRPTVPVVVQQPVVVAPPPPVVVVPPPVAYAPPPPYAYYAPPAVMYGPAPVYYGAGPRGPYKHAHVKKAHPHWKRSYRHR